MLESLAHLRHTDKGFDETGVLTARIGLSDKRYPEKDRWLRFFTDLLPKMAAFPGVHGAAFSLLVPLSDRSWEMGILPDNVAFDRKTTQSVLYNVVSRDYFRVTGIPLLKGRTFTASEWRGWASSASCPIRLPRRATKSASAWRSEPMRGR
jgi:putative ABC transport system permease protein